MNKRFSTLIAAVVAVVLGVCFAVSSFGFVKDGYGEDQITALAEIGLIEYRDTDSPVTRGEALVTLMTATGRMPTSHDYSAESTCPYVDMSPELKVYISAAYDSNMIGDMPYNCFREEDNITLEEMLHMALSAYGLTLDSESDVYELAQEYKIYKVCEADAFVFELTYASYAEILWNLVCAPCLDDGSKTVGDRLLDEGFMTPEAYSSAKSIMESYVFGQKHEYVTKAFSWSEAFADSESAEETTTARPAETSRPVTSYDTEDNSGFSPPFKP